MSTLKKKKGNLHFILDRAVLLIVTVFDTEDSSLEGSCTFLEFLKDCEPQDSKSEIHSFMHQVCTFVDFCFGKVFRDSVACQNTLNRFQHIWKTPLGIFTGPVDITNGRPMLIGVYSSPDRTDLQTTVRVVG